MFTDVRIVFCKGALRTMCSADSDVLGTALQEQTA